MCGRYYTRREKQQIAEHFRVSTVFADPLKPDYNIAASTFQPVIRQERDSIEREMVLLRWGRIPFFARSPAEFKGFSTINTRAETIVTSPTFRAALKTRRCIIPCDGFYEWKTLSSALGSRASKPLKQPFAFSLFSGDMLALAGVWDAWKEPKSSVQGVDTWLQSFSIITTEANERSCRRSTRACPSSCTRATGSAGSTAHSPTSRQSTCCDPPTLMRCKPQLATRS